QKIARLVVDARIETELLHDMIAFDFTAGDSDHMATPGLAQLSDDAAHRTGGRGNDERVAGLRLADLEQSEPCRYSRHAEHAEVIRRRRECRVYLVKRCRLGHAITLPAQIGQHAIARFERRILR